MYCPQCGSQSPAGATFCARCGTHVQSGAPLRTVSLSEKNAGLAAVLSFFWCGLGQIYNGQIAKGVTMVVCYFISFLLFFVLLGFLTTPVLWIWGMVDAYQTAEKMNTAMRSGAPGLNV